MRIEHRALGLALLGRSDVALRALPPPPAPRCRFADRKMDRRLGCRHPAFERRHNAFAQIQAVRFTHPIDPSGHYLRNRIMLPPPWESPRDSLFESNALVRYPLCRTGGPDPSRP